MTRAPRLATSLAAVALDLDARRAAARQVVRELEQVVQPVCDIISVGEKFGFLKAAPTAPVA